jgi:hypothetical protein
MRELMTQEQGCKQQTRTVGGSGACFDPDDLDGLAKMRRLGRLPKQSFRLVI